MGDSSSVVSEFEGTILKDSDTFAYFMLVAFEASGLVRFAVLLLLWPLIKFLDLVGASELGLRVAVFASVAGVPAAEIEAVSRAVLPKFFMDDVDMEAWKLFSRHDKRVVVTKMPRVLIEMFAKNHLGADEVIGPELGINRRFRLATGFLDRTGDDAIAERVAKVFFNGPPPLVGMGRRGRTEEFSFLSLCKEQINPPFTPTSDGESFRPPVPVIFHDGRLVKRPTATGAAVLLLYLPFGLVLSLTRIILGLLLPLRAVPYASRLFGGRVVVRGCPPPPPSPSSSGGGGVLFVCTHRTLMDPVVLSTVLGRRVPAVTYSISRVSELLSPIPTVRLTRTRHVDAERIRSELRRGDLAVCPEGTTCREPFLLRFSALFAELTDRIVPVAMNFRGGAGFFHATTARGWKGLDAFFFFMNPRPVYEVTFLSELPKNATCSAGNSPHDVANHVQRILAAALGFECTNFTRKDKYRVLAGNDGVVSSNNRKGYNRNLLKTLLSVMPKIMNFLY